MEEKDDLLLDAIVALQLLLGALKPEEVSNPRGIYYESPVDAGRFFCRYCALEAVQHAEGCPIGKAQAVTKRFRDYLDSKRYS